MKAEKFIFKLGFFIFLFLFFLVPNVFAAKSVTIYDMETLQAENSFLTEGDIAKGYNVAAGDINNDGKDEIILAPVRRDDGNLLIYDNEGNLINEIIPYYEGFSGGVSIACGDFDGDGKEEMVIGAGPGGSSQIRILDLNGQELLGPGFYAFGTNNYRGLTVAAADIDGDGKDEIVVGSGYGQEATVKIFDYLGNVKSEFPVNDYRSLYGVRVSSVDLSGDGYDEILVSANYGGKTKVGVYLANGTLLNEISAYNDKLNSGVSTLGMDIDNDGTGEIITVPGFTAGPHVKVFSHSLQLKKQFFTNHYTHDYGLNIAKGDVDGDGIEEFITVPQNTKSRPDLSGRYSEIQVSTQRFRIYDNGYELENMLTSTGKPSTPTRYGEFFAQTKVEMAYGGLDGVTWAMPKWIGFYYSGNLQNGIHALPYLNGIKEPSYDLGRAISHGCVRLSDFNVGKVYTWTEIGDPITVIR